MYVREEERPELEEDEFFVREMIDMDVVLVGVGMYVLMTMMEGWMYV